MEVLWRDVRYAARTLLREPAFTSLAVLALALGIGATTAVFTIVDSVLLRPLPYSRPDRLVVALHGPESSNPVSPADYADYRRSTMMFDAMGAAQAWSVTLRDGDRPERVAGLQLSANMFDLLGVPPLLGRTFASGEDQAGHEQVVVLGYGLWQRRFGGDASVIGRTIPLDGKPYVVIGVMPATFRFAPFWQTRAELWSPLSLERRREDRDGRSLRVFARLKDGVTVAQAQAEMSAVAARLEREYPATNTGVGITVRPLLDKVVSGIRRTLLVLLAMVTFVLLIACTNIASALLARAAGRQQEMALRLAIGASPSRLLRLLLTESMLLSIAAAAAGLVLAFWSISWILAALPPGSLPRQQEVGFDGAVFIVACLATMATGVLTGLAPAWPLTRPGLVAAFQSGGSRGATEGSDRRRLRGLLVAAEVMLALVLLTGAALMGRTMLALYAIDPGFRVDRVAVADVSLAGTPEAAPESRAAAYERIRERLSGMPGVVSVSAINHLPLAGDLWNLGYTIEGRPEPAPGQRWSAVYRVVQPGYFRTAGLRLLAGRDFSTADRRDSAPVVIVNQAMAERRWPGQSPLGQRIHLPGPGGVQAAIAIVGVAANAKQGDWTSAPADEVYLPFDQRSTEFGLASMTFLLQTRVDPRTVAAGIPGEVAQAAPGVPVSRNTTLAEVVRDELWRERLTAQLTGFFAVVALVLAAIGIYSAVSYSVARRTREFGVRMALGGTGSHVRWLAVNEGLRPAVFGAVGGVAMASASASLLDRLLFGVAALDPAALAAAASVLLLVAGVAAWLPARRASRLDPVAALREG